MRRREFIAGLGGTAAVGPIAARAQQRALPVIGFLHAGTEETRDMRLIAGFHQGLAEIGYIEGRNVAILYRYVESQYNRFRALAADLARRQVAIIFAPTDAAALAAKSATTTIPIVITTGLDPVDEGLVASLNHPGANITGVSMRGEELIGKRIELLHEIVPAAVTVGYLLNPIGGYPEAQTKDVETAARALGVQLAIFNANTASQIETAFATLVERRIGALTIGLSAFFSFQREQLVRLAAHHGIPVIYWRREFVDAGGLISYGSNGAEVYRLAGTYAGRILKGEKPADMPVQRSPRIEMVLNLKTAKALGIEIPPRVAVLADQVIE